MTHFDDALQFYGERLGLRIFRKHLAAYVENAPWPDLAETRRAARARLCRLDEASAVRHALTDLWTRPERLAA